MSILTVIHEESLFGIPCEYGGPGFYGFRNWSDSLNHGASLKLQWKAHREHKKWCMKTSTITISIQFNLQVFSQSGFFLSVFLMFSTREWCSIQPAFNSIHQAYPGSLLCTVLHLAIGFFSNEAKSNLCEHPASRACSLQRSMNITRQASQKVPPTIPVLNPTR